MMNLRSALAGLILIQSGFLASHGAETAKAVAYGLSIELMPSNPAYTARFGTATIYYSTFTGTAGEFLVQDFGAPTEYVTGEMGPAFGAPDIYEGGYEIDEGEASADFGSYTVTMPTTDTTGLGLPDVLNPTLPGSFTATGFGYDTEWGGTTFPLSIAFARAANSGIGFYTATSVDPGGSTSVFTGPFELVGYTGTITYSRGKSNTLTINLVDLTNTYSLSGTTTFTVPNANEIDFAAFYLGGSWALAGTLTRSGNSYTGALQFQATSWLDYSQYRFQIVDTNTTNGSGVPDLSAPLPLPTITTQPASQTVTAGNAVSFSVVASGMPTYQWYFDGNAIPQATGATLTLSSVSTASAGTYTVTLTNSGGSVTSVPVTLTINPAAAPPAISLPPTAQTVALGSTVVFQVAASGIPAPQYQWYLNGAPVPGATGARLVIFNATSANLGTYSVAATNPSGSATSPGAALTLADTTDIGRLINLSVRTNAGPSNLVTIGFFTGGTGTSGGQSLLLRGMGPSLTGFGVPNVLADPIITVFSGSTVVANNDNWAANQAVVSAADTATGAFSPSSPTSLDAALVASLAAGGYTMQLSGNGSANGEGLAECYDATPPGTYLPTSPRLTNLSCRTNLAAGAVLTAGFVIGGSTARTVLVRASGPALIPFGVSDTMADPQLTLFNNAGAAIDANAGWGGDPQITAVSNAVGAFAYANPSSEDSVVVVTLPPGAYTAQLSSVSNGGGEALVEVYEVP